MHGATGKENTISKF